MPGDLDHPPLRSAGWGRCRTGGHSAARAQDPRQRPGYWGEPRPQPPLVPRAQGPQTPVQGPEGHGGFKEHGREDPACHGELWQSRLRTVTARDHQTHQTACGGHPDGSRLPRSRRPWESAPASSGLPPPLHPQPAALLLLAQRAGSRPRTSTGTMERGPSGV